MNIDAAIEQIAGWAEDDWIGLWEIVAYVAEDLGVEESEQQLELTLALVKGLLKRGLCAGESPLGNTGPRFTPWREQDPDAMAALIRREWQRNDEFPALAWNAGGGGDKPGRLARFHARNRNVAVVVRGPCCHDGACDGHFPDRPPDRTPYRANSDLIEHGSPPRHHHACSGAALRWHRSTCRPGKEAAFPDYRLMDLVVGLLMLAVALLFVGCALYAARRK